MNDLYKLIEKFALEYLPTEKGCSKNTALSYYSTIKQYLEFYGYHISRNDIGILDFSRNNISSQRSPLRLRLLSSTLKNFSQLNIKILIFRYTRYSLQGTGIGADV